MFVISGFLGLSRLSQQCALSSNSHDSGRSCFISIYSSATILFTSFWGMGITLSPKYRPKQSAALVGAGCGAAASIGIAAVSGAAIGTVGCTAKGMLGCICTIALAAGTSPVNVTLEASLCRAGINEAKAEEGGITPRLALGNCSAAKNVTEKVL